MFRPRVPDSFLTALALAAALALPAGAQVWEPGDPPRDAYEARDMDFEADTSVPPQVPDAPPDAETREDGTPPEARQTDDPEDFLCGRAPAGKAAPLPAPFNLWLVRVCTPQGQALVPVLGEAWVVHGTADPVSILAMPPGAIPPPTTGAFDARYDIRFESFQGGKTEGARRERAAALIETASGQDKAPPYGDIWQLDAVSNVAETRYNLFFYLAGDRPGQIIACLDQCRQALYFDVLKGKDAKEALGR